MLSESDLNSEYKIFCYCVWKIFVSTINDGFMSSGFNFSVWNKYSTNINCRGIVKAVSESVLAGFCLSLLYETGTRNIVISRSVSE